MPFRLSTELSDGYWTHNSGGEHTLKHPDIPGRINAIRSEYGGYGLDEDELRDMMFRDGLVVVRQEHADGRVGDVAGYVVSDRRHPGLVEVKDLFVIPEHRGRGVGGFLLGRLITTVRHDGDYTVTSAYYGNELQIADKSYQLPGMHVQANAARLNDSELSKFLANVPGDWLGIRTVITDDASTHEVFRAGEVVAQLEELAPKVIRVEGRADEYSHLVFAAMAVHNNGPFQLPR